MQRGVARRQLLVAGLSPVGPDSAIAAAGAEVFYPRLSERPPSAYGYQLLELALRRSGRPYVLRLDEAPMSSRRAVARLGEPGLRVLDTGATAGMAARFEMVAFPIDFGLSGCRVLLARHETLARLDAMRSLADLRALRLGQGFDWADTRILRRAGLTVVEGAFDGLLRMLQAGRFDLLPLGIEEAHDLLAAGRAEAPDVGIHEGLALLYPFVRVYYVPKGQQALAAAILDGLLAADADGSLVALLKSSNGLGPVLNGRRPVPARQLVLPNPWWPQALAHLPLERFHPAIRAAMRRVLASA